MSTLGSFLERWVARVVAAPRRVVIVMFAVTAAGAWIALGHLKMNTDTTAMFSETLRWRQVSLDYQRAFPRGVDTIDVVVDAATPDLADLAADRLAAALTADTAVVEYAERAGGGDFFGRTGLLYLDLEALDALVLDLVRAQPVLGSLAGDPTLAGLAKLLDRAFANEVDAAGPELIRLLDDLTSAAEATTRAELAPVSWRRMGGLEAGAPRAFVIVKARLDYGELLPSGPVMARVRELARELGLTPENGVRVRITGSNAMEHEELETVASGAATTGTLALVTVLMVLWWGLRSWRAVGASLVTLLAGLVLTTAYAALAIGHLNVISVAFAVLYIGLGVDYAIHFCLRYRELATGGMLREGALARAAGDVGASLVVCAVTTGAGFFAFVPTDFSGVSELGAIAGAGMFIGLAVSLTLLPALLALVRTPAGAAGDARRRGAWVARRAPVVLAVASVLGAVSLVALPRVHFDGNPLGLRDAESESVATYRDLLSDPDTSPWSLEALVVDAPTARALAARLEALEEVDAVVSVEDLIPGEQEAKLELVAELDLLYAGALAGRGPRQEEEAAGPAVRRLSGVLRGAESDEPAIAAAAARLSRALSTLEVVPGGAERFERAAVGTLEAEIARLDLALAAAPVTLESLPKVLRDDWVAADGRWRLTIQPVENLAAPDARSRFVDAVTALAPSVTGTPLIIDRSGRAVVDAFVQAFATALVLIVVLLALLLRSPGAVVLVVGPLLLAGLVTVAVMVAVGVPFNFANVIALPLLLGVGVDSGIHLVHRMRVTGTSPADVLTTSTSRAVVVSALTTTCSFGNLVFSPHPGTASMGFVLSVGMVAALTASLLLLPALAARWPGLVRP